MFAAACVLVLIGWWWVGGQESPAAAARPSGVAAEPDVFVDNPNGVRLDLAAAPTEPDTKYPAALFDPARFDGVAKLEVNLVVTAALEGPWVLSLEPSKVVLGGEHAVARRVEYPATQRHVVLEDVALGGYVVRALAEGMECAPQYVQFALPDDVDVILRLDMVEAGTLRGRVVAPDGTPVERIEVRLRRAESDEERVTTTDFRGEYAFERLPDSEYVLLVGRATAPIARRELAFSAPGLTMPDVATPALGELSVRVLDAQLHPVPGATVSLTGLASGANASETDTEGFARFPLCTAGAVHIVAEHPQFAVSTSEAKFDPARPETIEIRVGAR